MVLNIHFGRNIWSFVQREWIGIFIINLGFLSNGFSFAYPSIVIPQSRNGTFLVTPTEASWIGGAIGIGGIIGSLIATVIGQMIGNRKMLMVSCVFDVIGWIMIGSASSSILIIIGRVFNGMFISCVTCMGNTYMAEIARPKYRLVYSYIISCVIVSGILISYGLGYCLPWYIIAYTNSLISFLMTLGFLFLSDTPYWYLTLGDSAKALKSLQFYRPSDEDVSSEFNDILSTFNQNTKDTKRLTFWNAMKELKSNPLYYRPFLILNFLFFLQHFTGNFAVRAYLVTILTYSEVPIQANIGSIISASTIALMCLILIILTIYVKRKVLLITSCLLGAIFIGSLGIYELLKEDVITNVKILPFILLTLYTGSFSIGLQGFPLLYIAEFYKSEIRQHLAGLTICFFYINYFVVLTIFFPLVSLIEYGGIYILFSGINLLTIPYVVFFIPETKDLPIDEIQALFIK